MRGGLQTNSPSAWPVGQSNHISVRPRRCDRSKGSTALIEGKPA